MYPHWQFFLNVLSHWVASMSGIVSLAIGFYEKTKNAVASKYLFAIAGICMVVAFDQAWMDEHRNTELLIGQKSVLWQERDFWKQQSYARDDALRSRDQLLAQNYSALIKQQETLNNTQDSMARLADKILDLSKPEPQKFIVRRDESDSEFLARWKRHTQLLIMTNRPAKAHVVVSCEQAMPGLEAHIVEGGPRFPMSVEKEQDNAWLISIPSPEITPQYPMLVNIGYNSDSLGGCRLQWQ
jgi:hypothetical protein